MEKPTLMAAVSKRAESVLRFAHVVNEMKILRPEPEGKHFGSGLQGLMNWWWSKDVSRPFEDDVKTAIQRAIVNHELPPKDMPSAEKFKDAVQKSTIELLNLVPPQSNDCDLLTNPGTHSHTNLT
jgi:hypothetical protein